MMMTMTIYFSAFKTERNKPLSVYIITYLPTGKFQTDVSLRAKRLQLREKKGFEVHFIKHVIIQLEKSATPRNVTNV